MCTQRARHRRMRLAVAPVLLAALAGCASGGGSHTPISAPSQAFDVADAPTTSPPEVEAAVSNPAQIVGVDALLGTVFLADASVSADVEVPPDGPASPCPGQQSMVTAVSPDGTTTAFAVPGQMATRIELGAGTVGFIQTDCGDTENAILVTDRHPPSATGFTVRSGAHDWFPDAYLRSAPYWVSQTSIAAWTYETGTVVVDLMDESITEEPLDADTWQDRGGGESPRVIATWPRTVVGMTPFDACRDPSFEQWVVPPALAIISPDGLTPVSPAARDVYRNQFAGMRSITFTGDNRLVWVAGCPSHDRQSIYTAVVDPATGEFEQVNVVLDAARALQLGWPSELLSGSDGNTKQIAAAWTPDGNIVVWSLASRQLYRALFQPNGDIIDGPTPISAADGSHHAPFQVDLQISEPSGPPTPPPETRPPDFAGTADRAAVLFHSYPTYPRLLGSDSPTCTQTSEVVMVDPAGFAAGTKALATVLGAVETVHVDGFSTVWIMSYCNDTPSLTVARLGEESPGVSIDFSTARSYGIDDSWRSECCGWPRLALTNPGAAAWGHFGLDTNELTLTWAAQEPGSGIGRLAGRSDSGRFEYRTQLGLVIGDGECIATGPGTTWVRDTATDEVRTLGIAANPLRFVFGPDDEVGWIEGGGECGSTAYLGEVDWDDGGTISQAFRVGTWETVQDWAWTSGPTNYGPDGLSFAHDGDLVLWAYSYQAGNDPDFRLKSLRLSLADCEAGHHECSRIESGPGD